MNYSQDMDFWTTFRLTAFILGLLIFTGLGLWRPRRPLGPFWLFRYIQNILIGALNPILIRIMFGWGLVEWTIFIKDKGWGLLNLIAVPDVIAAVLVIIFLDGVIYWQHVVFHKVPLLWRLHRVHHSDTEFDSSTALRFHFVEIALSFLLKACMIGAIGGPVAGVVLFEIVLNFSAMFNHANWKLPEHADERLRKVIVTPDFHRVHHSPNQVETNSNYGFFLSVWDYLFRSYRAQPEGGHEAMTIGLEEFRGRNENSVVLLWFQPLRKK